LTSSAGRLYRVVRGVCHSHGVRLFYEERGEGTPILGIHGGGSSAVFWEDAAERLSELGRVLTYDRRGSNRSERPDPYEITSIAEHSDDVLALMRALDAEPAVLVGRSYGATIALDLGLRHPDSVLVVALFSRRGLRGSRPNTRHGLRQSPRRSNNLPPSEASTPWERT
jgi:pimeloyl-ACP methyl ester carboxylesterase